MVGIEAVIAAVVSFILGYLLRSNKPPEYEMTKQLLKEIGEAFIALYEALSDDSLSEDEVKQLREELRDIYETLKSLF